MTDVAKMARELRVGDVLRPDSLPQRVIRSLEPVGELVVARSTGTQGGEYEETFSRERLVTIQV